MHSLLVAVTTLLAAIGEAVTPRLAIRVAENDRQGFLALNLRFVGLVALVCTAMVAGIGLFLGRLDHAVLMLGRAVERVELERPLAGVADIVPRAGRDDYPAAVGNVISVVVYVDLTVGAGELLAVLGPNGAGKTTALSMLMGLTTPTSGTARLFGRDPRDLAARQRMGVMLQSSGVPDTLRILPGRILPTRLACSSTRETRQRFGSRWKSRAADC